MRLTAFFKLYKICNLLHRCNLKIFAKNRFEKSAIFVRIQQHFCKCRKICKILNFAKFQKIQLDNLVDLKKCCKTHICLQKSVPIPSKTNKILPKFCQKLANFSNPPDGAHVPPARGPTDGSRFGRGPSRARFMTGGGYRLLASANLGELVLGCIEAKFCK